MESMWGGGDNLQGETDKAPSSHGEVENRDESKFQPALSTEPPFSRGAGHCPYSCAQKSAPINS